MADKPFSGTPADLKSYGSKVAAEMVKGIRVGAASNNKWMKDNGWDDKTPPAGKATASPLLK